jgi:uncharacterized protein
MRFSVVLVRTAALLMLAIPASLSTAAADDTTTCVNASGDEKIAACTRAIASGTWRGSHLSWAYNNRGNAYRAKDDNDRAIQDYDQAIKLDPKHVNAHIGRGNAYHDKGDNDRAIADYNEAIRFDSKNADAYNDRANAYSDKGDNDRAMQDYDQAIKLDPNEGVNYRTRGVAYNEHMKDRTRALADLERALALDPKDWRAWAYRGELFRSMGDHDRAIADLTKAIAIEGRSYHYGLRGDSYGDKKDFDRSIADYNEAIRLDPKNARYWNSRCWERALAGQLEQALKDCNESLRLRPNDADTLDSRGFTYFKLGRFDDAVTDYDAALKLAPQLASSLYSRGVARKKKGDSAGGEADMAAAKVIDGKIAETYAGYGVTFDPSTASRIANSISGWFGGTKPPGQVAAPSSPKPGAPDELGGMITGILGELDDRWSEFFQASGQPYAGPKIVLFRNATDGGRCGMVQAAMGPFYCALDRKIFLDTGVFRQIETHLNGCLGNACKLTAAYVIARQVGHHVQNLLGILPRVAQVQQASDKTKSDALQDKVELQADCLAGLWVNREEKKRPGFIETGDVDAALNAASALGDNTSGEQRKHWFMVGYQQGTMQACNTFGAENL